VSLRVRDVSVRLAGKVILDRIDIEVDDGVIVAVLGPSGSGKTTLLRVIAGLQPAEGTVSWAGENLDGIAPHRRNFGLMFQDYALFPHRSVAANVSFGLEMRGDAAASSEHRVAEVLGWVGLAGYERRSVATLSGGEQQRVALARALAPEPRLLMLDEPVGSLDKALRTRLLDELRDILADQGITTLFVTHDQDEAFALSDRVIIMREGRIVQSGKPEQIWSAPTDAWTARFLGMTNIVTGYDGHVGTVVIRPDAIRPDDGGTVRLTITSTAFKEGGYLVAGVTEDGTNLVFPSDRRLAPDDTVTISIDPAGIVPLG